MKPNIKKILLIILIVLLCVSILIFFTYKHAINNPIKSEKEVISIDINEGEGFYSVLNKLKGEDALSNETFIKIYLKLNGSDLKVIPGTYDIKSNITLEELISLVTTEDISKNMVRVTIKEGYTIDSIAEAVGESGIISKDEFINAVKSYPLPSYVSNNAKKKYNLEGFLYPETYFFDKNSSAEVLVSTMIKTFEKKIKEVEEETGITIEEKDYETIVIKASLVEKEAVLKEERPLVASVINNRLKQGMKLEFCSSVNYVIGHEGNEVLTYEDIKVESPYNTYKYAGLPVGSVGNPGYDSLKAAVKPADTDYLFFVLLYGEGGKQHFSTTYEEHNRVKIEQDNKRKNAN